MTSSIRFAAWATLCFAYFIHHSALPAEDFLRKLQTEAIEKDRSPVGHWGTVPKKYTQWGTHSSRLIPVYTFGTKGAGRGIGLAQYTGRNSPYRDESAIRSIFGTLPEQTLNDEARYCDQTNIADIQRAALEAGKKYIFLVIFDGMDWQTTRAAAIYRTGKVEYERGRGTGLHFQDYQADGTTQFGFMVTSPAFSKGDLDVDQQTVTPSGAPGGYSAALGGAFPWAQPADLPYLIGKSKELVHGYPDSASTATSMMSGVKTYNASIGIDRTGGQVPAIAHLAQERGYGVGVVTSVPISHATPAAAYAHNVSRDDFQDISRDLLGLPSISHPERPLEGLDVVIGGGYGVLRETDSGQGKNFKSGNRYLHEDDLRAANLRHGGKYHVVTRQSGVSGGEHLQRSAELAAAQRGRLLGLYGVGAYAGHLPYQTANGDYEPAIGRSKKAEVYTEEDVRQNPTLAEMTSAALRVLSVKEQGFWLMVEAGDVDWANHDNNLDNSIGAVFSGDDAVREITDWVEQHSNWKESVLIVTADHGHYLFLDRPELLIDPTPREE
jgi:alkaline phosphatase